MLHKASGGAAGCGAPCGIAGTMIGSSSSSSSVGAGSRSGVAGRPTTTTTGESTGIWSTMKHLMNHGHHNQHAAASNPVNSSVASSFLGNTHGGTSTVAGEVAPNVVDLTTTARRGGVINNNNNNSTTTTTATSSSSGHTTTKRLNNRPWSKQARILRNATVADIAPNLQPSRYFGGKVGAAVDVAGVVVVGRNGVGITTGNNNINATASPPPSLSSTGFKRLWRGVQTMFIGCVPAHALYFSSYEIIKSMSLEYNKKAFRADYHLQQQQQQQQQLLHVNDADAKKETEAQQQHHHQKHQPHANTLSPTQAMLAGGVATLLHDCVMTPMDTMKQRMQLGHYDNLRHAFVSIVWGDVANGGGGKDVSQSVVRTGGEGWKGLYRSLPVTVMTNIPYGMIMMTTNEWLRGVLEDGIFGVHQHTKHHADGDDHYERPFHFTTILLSGMGAGTIAAFLTAPLDRVKTRLQTQRMGMVVPSSSISMAASSGGGGSVSANNAGVTSAIMEERALAAAKGERMTCPKMVVRDVKQTLFPSTVDGVASSTTATPSQPHHNQLSAARPRTPFAKTYYTTPLEAFRSILQEEGPRGLFRGTLPRVALHAPSVAISWTAYEMAKGWLVWWVED